MLHKLLLHKQYFTAFGDLIYFDFLLYDVNLYSLITF